MNWSKDLSTSSTCPKLRADLVIVPQVVGGIQTYMVKDPLIRAYHRIGEMEYTIMSLLDGQNSFQQILRKFGEKSKGLILEAKNLEDFLKYLQEADLMEKPKTEKSILFYQKMKDKRRRRLSGKFGLKNIFELSFPAFDPNRLFDKIVHPLRFLWSRGFLIFTFFCFFSVILIASSNWEAFKRATFSIYSLKEKGLLDFVLIYLLFFMIVGIHECAHGLTCKYYGGEVHELGFILYYFQPCFYCQVDDSYLFQNKYHRIAVMTAGAYSELILCSFAIFIWWLTPPHIFLHQVSAYVLALSGFIVVIFNFNPLMKYDGYYILSDYLEVLNLREQSFEYIGNWLKKSIFRMAIEPQDLFPRLKKIFVIYGVLALLYSGFVLSVIILMAKDFLISHYHIWGIMILLGLLYFLFRKKVKKLLGILKGYQAGKKSFSLLGKYPLPFFLGLLILVYGLFFLKIDWQITKDFTIEPKGRFQVRSPNFGFIREVAIKEGDEVSKDQLLVRIENDSLEDYTLGLRNELNSISQVIRLNYFAQNASLLEADLEEKRRLEIDLKEAEKKLEKLKIYSPVKGKVLTPRVEEKLGVFIGRGEVFCELGDLSKLEAKIYFHQWEIGDIEENHRVELKIPWHSSSFKGAIDLLSLNPQPAPSALYEAQVRIENPKETLKPGMMGKAKILCDKVSLSEYLYRKIFRSIRTELWK